MSLLIRLFIRLFGAKNKGKIIKGFAKSFFKSYLKRNVFGQAYNLFTKPKHIYKNFLKFFKQNINKLLLDMAKTKAKEWLYTTLVPKELRRLIGVFYAIKQRKETLRRREQREEAWFKRQMDKMDREKERNYQAQLKKAFKEMQDCMRKEYNHIRNLIMDEKALFNMDFVKEFKELQSFIGSIKEYRNAVFQDKTFGFDMQDKLDFLLSKLEMLDTIQKETQAAYGEIFSSSNNLLEVNYLMKLKLRELRAKYYKKAQEFKISNKTIKEFLKYENWVTKYDIYLNQEKQEENTTFLIHKDDKVNVNTIKSKIGPYTQVVYVERKVEREKVLTRWEDILKRINQELIAKEEHQKLIRKTKRLDKKPLQANIKEETPTTSVSEYNSQVVTKTGPGKGNRKPGPRPKRSGYTRQTKPKPPTPLLPQARNNTQERTKEKSSWLEWMMYVPVSQTHGELIIKIYNNKSERNPSLIYNFSPTRGTGYINYNDFIHIIEASRIGKEGWKRFFRLYMHKSKQNTITS